MFKCLFISSFLFITSFSIFANEEIPSKKKTTEPSSATTEVSIKDPYLRLADDIQRYSKKFMGIHYVWGGKVTQGFDCSGLVSYVFAQFGMKIELPSAALFKLGYDMPPAAALPGDLIFFRRSTDKKSDISHVGIVLESNECGVKFIHSSRGKGVAISYLHEKYYATHFGGVRRVMDSLKEYKY